MWQTQSYNNAIDNFKVEKSASKSAQNLCIIHKNGVQNFHFIGHRILKTLRNIFGDRSFASAGVQVWNNLPSRWARTSATDNSNAS